MNFLRLTPEQRQAVCEDLLAIERAGRLPDVWAVRRCMLRDFRPASPWEQVAADRLAREASNICGGNLAQWRDAAAAALGLPSRAAVGIEAVCQVADDLRWQEPEREPEPASEKPRHRATLNSRKRGGR
jgi:hypothetical protein